MQKWEYKVVTVTVFDIGDAVKHREKRTQLDPDLTDQDWMRRTWKDGRQDITRVAWSDRGCWTTFSNALRELGDEGWELAGTTPQLEQYVASGTADRFVARYPDFWLTFKRPVS